jgi:hypothetical protein
MRPYFRLPYRHIENELQHMRVLGYPASHYITLWMRKHARD